MELFVALAGVTGLALLLQAKPPLPSDVDFKKAQDKLVETPEDPDANTTVGKYISFVQGDYSNGMRFFLKSTDKKLKTLAEHETAPLYTDSGPQKVGMGDEWVAAGKNFPALSRIFYDRGSQWYSAAWPDLQGPWKDKAREQGAKLAASRPPGSMKKSLPAGWQAETAIGGSRSPVLDGTISHLGSYSAKMVPGDEKIPGSWSGLKSDLIPALGKVMEISAFVRSDSTENAGDRVFVNLFNQAGVGFGTVGPFIPTDVPFWSRIYLKVDLNPNTSRIQFGVQMQSKKGSIWVDDCSVKIDGKEILKNGSFEQ